tara:strand:- start:719 stop:1165 length:447 start_codon:yes stop_codon:yes gene_type:complete
MIIACPCGEKKFEIDESLIPEKGRNLQCGSCNRKWFYKKPIKEELVEKVNPKIDLNEVEDATEHKVEETDKKEIDENNQIEKEKKVAKNKINILRIILVFLISFVALIIIIDTFESPLKTVFPNIDLLMNSLYETLHDIVLFIKDLFY